MRRTLVPIVVLALMTVGLAHAQAPAPVKIGVFDAGRVSEETAEGKRVQAKLTAFGEKKKAEITAKQKEMADLQGQLSAQALSLSAEKRVAIEKEVQKKAMELNQAQEAAQREMQLEVAEAQNSFQEQLIGLVDQFGRDEGFTLILERSFALYVSPSVDITTAIVDRFNRAFPGKPEEPAGAKPATAPAAPAPAPAAPEKKK